METSCKVVQSTSVFVAWTVTSFLCHQSARLFLITGKAGTTMDIGIVWTVLITFAQMSMCYLLTDIQPSDTQCSRSRNFFKTKVSCHVLATMATNYSMTLVDSSSTFAIKLLEPITSAVVQYFVLSIPISPTACLSLPIVIGGAVVFCLNSLTTSMSVLGVVMAGLSNVLLAFRNVAIKMNQSDKSENTIQLRGKQGIIASGIVLVSLIVLLEYLASQSRLPPFVVFMTVTATFSSVFHVIYSYISTNIVLLYMSVVSHSITNIFKRVLVVLLMYAMGQREATLTNFVGLAVCTAGLLVYVSAHQRNPGVKHNSELNHLMLWKQSPLTLVLLLCCLGLTFSNFSENTNRIFKESRPQHAHIEDIRPRQFSKQAINFVPENLVDMNSTHMYFLRRRLITSPTETDDLSPVLNSTFDVIREAQRIHVNLFSDMFSKYKYTMLFDIAAFENKGDPAITAGEVYLLRRLGIELVYYCNFHACSDSNLNHAKNLSSKYSVNELIVLLQGGGNVVGYKPNDKLRGKIFKLFSQFQIVLFPQSIYLKNNTKHLRFCQELYQNNENFTMILRDKQSLQYAQKLFSGKGKLMMAPDMAFQIGAVPRFIPPSFDILWLKRSDGESPKYEIPKYPPGVSVYCADWWAWKTPKGETSMETAFMMANNGLVFVQRGRVVITDRLHGHILSILCDIPHVLIDNNNRKLSSYHNTWTRGLSNTVLADNATHALELAIGLLKKYDEVLPPIMPFMNVREKAEVTE